MALLVACSLLLWRLLLLLLLLLLCGSFRVAAVDFPLLAAENCLVVRICIEGGVVLALVGGSGFHKGLSTVGILYDCGGTGDQ